MRASILSKGEAYFYHICHATQLRNICPFSQHVSPPTDIQFFFQLFDARRKSGRCPFCPKSRHFPTFLSRRPSTRKSSVVATFFRACSTLSCSANFLRPGGKREGAHFARSQGISPTQSICATFVHPRNIFPHLLDVKLFAQLFGARRKT